MWRVRMEYIISLDLGTSAFKVALFDADGRIVEKSTQEYTLLTPDALSVELDVNTYWNAFKQGLADVIGKAKISLKDIKAFGLSAQGETLIPIDNNGKALRNAIVWMDNRAQKEAEELNRHFGEEKVYKTTGQVSIVPTWPASKLLWIKRTNRIYSRRYTGASHRGLLHLPPHREIRG
jgi:xylulokinase